MCLTIFELHNFYIRFRRWKTLFFTLQIKKLAYFKIVYKCFQSKSKKMEIRIFLTKVFLLKIFEIPASCIKNFRIESVFWEWKFFEALIFQSSKNEIFTILWKFFNSMKNVWLIESQTFEINYRTNLYWKLLKRNEYIFYNPV